MEKGVIFDIKEFAIYDGPGIRETVFFKGCPLRCVWCHNPEGLSAKKELILSKASCIKCGKCQGLCRREECDLCGKCVDLCPLSLRKICGEELTSDELSHRLLSHKEYYSSLGGGVTFSGGEPLFQYEFLFEVLDKLNGVHRAVETSAYCEEDVFRRLLTRCELVIMDIKHMNTREHRKYTGVGNEKIHKNYHILVETGFPHIIRMPVIPTVNDTVENFTRLAELLKKDDSLVVFELLPYHRTAGAKYQSVGRVYSPPFDENKEPIIHKEIIHRAKVRYRVL